PLPRTPVRPSRSGATTYQPRHSTERQSSSRPPALRLRPACSRFRRCCDSMAPVQQTARRLRDAIANGTLTAEAAAQAALSRIAASDGSLHAFHLVLAERA